MLSIRVLASLVLLYSAPCFGQLGGTCYQPDDEIAGLSRRKLQKIAVSFQLTSREKELFRLTRERDDAIGEGQARNSKELEEARTWFDRYCLPGTSLYIYTHRSTKFLRGGYCVIKNGMVSSSFILASDLTETYRKIKETEEAAQERKREKVAQSFPWDWHEERAVASYCAAQPREKYEVHLEERDDPAGIAFSISFENRKIYSWIGDQFTVFDIYGDQLFFADFQSYDAGGKIIAVSLASGTQLWSSELQAIGGRAVGHDVYGNRLNLAARKDCVVVFGRESYGDYVEIKDAKTGETIGHKIVRKGFR